MPSPTLDVLVVGAGFAGAVAAERLASAGREVLVIDKRPHIGGNAFDEYDEHGVLIHRYGPHIFHTQSSRVFAYLSRFTAWRPYEHRVQALVDGRFHPIPINRTTINGLYDLQLDEQGVADYLAGVRKNIPSIKTSEDAVLASVGADLCEKFFRGYTRKQWGLELHQLAASVASRIPTRTNSDDRYFTDQHQSMPSQGYTAMFRNLLDHRRIRVETGVDYFAANPRLAAKLTVFTGPVDAYFDYCHGALPYRSLEFRHEHLGQDRYQHTGTVNFPNDYEYTRITEFKYLTGQDVAGTSIVREFPRAEGDPYYPIPNPDNEARYQRYKTMARAESDVVFVGRLAQYRYYNMDQVVAASLKTVRDITALDDEYTSNEA
jgi:UDP-galactopyranose mutase